MARYTTRDEAIAREIVEPIENGTATADEFDIEAIAEETLAFKVDHDEHGNELVLTAGYEQIVDADEFWTVVARHAR